MPPSERMEEIGALATIVDENRLTYNLDDLCKWRGVAGKDAARLEQAAAALAPQSRKRITAQSMIHLMPAQDVGPYAEQDAASTLLLWESLDPVLDREGTRAAYRLEVDLLPMVHEMRRRGIRVDEVMAHFAIDELKLRRDGIFEELGELIGERVGMEEIGRNRWLAEKFDKLGIKYPRTAKDNPSFTAPWMRAHPHPFPQLIVRADKLNNAASKFLETYIVGHTRNGRVHAEIHPHRSDEGGTRSLRFSYSDPPLQQMSARDEEIAPLIRGCFLPEDGEVWAKPDVSQQEYRFIVHYAAERKLLRAEEAARRYAQDPDTDFHRLVMDWTGLDRQQAKNVNFAKSYGAGVAKLVVMFRDGGVEVTEADAAAIYKQYDRELPFVSHLFSACQVDAERTGITRLYDGALRHWDMWEISTWHDRVAEFAPRPRAEAKRLSEDPSSKWYRQPLRRADTRKAMNALIQGSSARHTKLAMRAIHRELGIVPLLQMHDEIDVSVTSEEQALDVAACMRDAVSLRVPMKVDLRFGNSWGDAKHEWDEVRR